MSTVAQNQRLPLPLEVCELIINQLAWTPKPDNIGALKACALASRTFLPCCRKHLFKTIKVLPELESSANVTVAQRHGRATARLTAPLIINPDLAQYVRILHVCVRDTNHDDRFFAQMLRRLKNIEKLFIKSRRGPNDLFKRWNNIATGIRTSLEGTMTSPSLLELNLNSIHEVPCYLLASARNLRHLGFLNVTFSIQHPPEAQTLPIPSLKSLSFSNADASITTLLQARFNQSPVFSLAHLKHIVLPMEFDAATEILRSATSIESIALVGKPFFTLFAIKSCGTDSLLSVAHYRAILQRWHRREHVTHKTEDFEEIPRNSQGPPAQSARPTSLHSNNSAKVGRNQRSGGFRARFTTCSMGGNGDVAG